MPFSKDITLGRYIPADSVLHRLDPRIKILAVVLFLFVLLWSQVFPAVIGALAIVILLGKATGLPLRLLLGNLKPLAPILVLTFILHALLTPGTIVLTLSENGVRISQEGLAQGLFLVLRLCAIVLTTSLLTLTTSPLELADGLELLLSPFQRLGLPAHELAMTTTIALRFIPILADEANRLREAQLARGADFNGGPIRKMRSFLPLLLPLFVSAFGRADRLAVAMEARAYRGQQGRSRFQVLVFNRTDLAALACTILISALLLALVYY